MKFLYNVAPMFRILFLYIVITFFGLLNLVQAQPISNSRTLSLHEAILLAVRENPNVQQSQMNHVMAKFSLEVQQWQFRPHFAFQATRNDTRTVTSGNLAQSSNQWSVTPSASWQSPIGTQMTLTSTNNIGNGVYNPGLSLNVVQPLLRGFGQPIVEAALNNAIDSERISRLTVQGTLRTTITAVINAYLDVISAEHTVKNDMNALKRAQTSVQQTKMFIKAGRKAGVELVTVEADVANSQTKLENDKNALQQARYALLTAIGIDPNTNVEFSSLDVPGLIKKFRVPDLNSAKLLILDHDIQYQTDQITIKGATKRAVAIAKDNTRWQLNLNANAGVGNSSGGGQNSGINSLTNGYNQTQQATLTLTVPIDDKLAQQALMTAKIGLQEAEIALRQEKWQKETNAINGWNTISSAERALHFAEDAEKLQLKTYNISFQKYSYGLIDSLELQSAQQQLNQSEQALIDARVNYLKALVNLDQLIGNTLNTWDIEVQYG